MALKYEQLDVELFSWLGKHRRGVTTAQAARALKVTNITAKRHLSRRFSQLEDRGNLVCELVGTARVCKVVGALPTSLAKGAPRVQQVAPPNQQIAANDAEGFLAAGGKIERLPAAWDNPDQVSPKGSLPLGEGYAIPFFGVDSVD